MTSNISSRAFRQFGSADKILVIRGRIATVLKSRGRQGDLDRAIELREWTLREHEQRGDHRSVIVAQGAIADILQVRCAPGDLDEALRIRRTIELPWYEQQGDKHMCALVYGDIADALECRNHGDDVRVAIEHRRDFEIPLLVQLDRQHAHAVALGNLAHALRLLGDTASLEEAMQIRSERQLPLLRALGDRDALATASSRLADLHCARGREGDVERALEIHEQDVIPLRRELGDVRNLANALRDQADVLAGRGRDDDLARARSMYVEALRLWELRGDELQQAHIYGRIADVFARGARDPAILREALEIRRERQLLPYRKHGHALGEALTLENIAALLFRRNEPGDRAEAIRIQREAVSVWRGMTDTKGLASALESLADFLETTSEDADHDEAVRLRREEVDLHDVRDVRARARSLERLARTMLIGGGQANLRDAARILDDVTAMLQEEPDPALAMRVHCNRIILHASLRSADYDHAFETLRQLARETATRASLEEIAHAWHRAALAMSDDPDRAQAVRREELEVRRKIGDRRGVAFTLWKLGDILESEGARASAESILAIREEELSIYRVEGDVRAAAMTIGQIARVMESRSPPIDDQALAMRLEQAGFYEQQGDGYNAGLVYRHVAWLLCERSRVRDDPADVGMALDIVRERVLALPSTVVAQRLRLAVPQILMSFVAGNTESAASALEEALEDSILPSPST